MSTREIEKATRTAAALPAVARQAAIAALYLELERTVTDRRSTDFRHLYGMMMAALRAA